MLQAQVNRKKRLLRPVQFICLSFLIIILSGTVLLMMPICSVDGEFTSFIDSLFTATSATCVTGLSVYDTYTHWSPFGQGVILILIQMGGLGFVTFSTAVSISLRGRLGIRDMRLAGEYISVQNLGDVQKLLINIIRVTAICEGVGAVLLAIPFVSLFGTGGIWMAVFTAVSSYCNAGFDVFGFIYPGCSIQPFVGNWIVMTVVPALIILGGLGFLVFNDIFTNVRCKYGSRRLSLHSKIVLFATGFLLIFGFVSILGIEWNRAFSELTVGEKISSSFFSSVTARTAGYASVNYADVTSLTKLITVFLMFIGASPVSTGGGIKTTTAMVLIMTMVGVIKGREDTVIFGRRIKKSVVYKTLSLAVLSIALVGTATILLWFIEPEQSLIDLTFISVSAFSTTGLSPIDLGAVHYISKLILCFLMYVGRVGPLSFFLTLRLRGKKIDKQVTLPEGELLVG